MHSKIDNIEIMSNDRADEVIKELFKSLEHKYQDNLEWMKRSQCVFIRFIYCIINKCHKNCGASYIDLPDWIKNKKATVNPINKKNNECFQYAVTVTLNYEEIGKNPERITKITTTMQFLKKLWKM